MEAEVLEELVRRRRLEREINKPHIPEGFSPRIAFA
jgi:hypothetical protein